MENENYLADWLSDKISDDELKQLVSTTDFLAYQKLKDTLQNFAIVEPDLDKNYRAIKEKLASKSSKPSKKIISISRFTAIAASLLLFFGLYNLYFTSNEFKTGFGKTNSIVLNDESRIQLNSNSSIEYPNFFQFNRSIQLKGEAFFEVQKGSQFTVSTALGKVTVLGTKFNVAAFDDYFEVYCYEGKVRVNIQSKSVVLTAGQSSRVFNSEFENWATNDNQLPNWNSEESSFKNKPMKYVFEKFKNQYGVDLVYPEDIESIRYTGSFSNSNIQTALKSICIPLNLNYSNTSSRTIIISK
jgi:ferric-dicitrate binding protein FerR (iron transport regulator)